MIKEITPEQFIGAYLTILISAIIIAIILVIIGKVLYEINKD